MEALDVEAPQAVSAVASTMRALVQRSYGTPDVLALEQLPCPVPGPREVLVRVHAANVSIGDHHVITGKPYPIRLSPYGGFPRPKHLVPGTAMAGRVARVGENVSDLQVGDEVFGQIPCGAFAEYALAPVSALAPKPSALSFEQAAVVPWALAALQGLRDAGGLKPGHRVLINGASGGVGSWAVQIAKALGAEVTAVCGTHNVDFVRALGADQIIDYRCQDFAAEGPRFDLLLDLVGNRALADCRRALRPRGTYVASSGRGGDWFGPLFRIAHIMASAPFTDQKLVICMAKPSRAELLVLTELVDANKIRPAIERSYTLAEARDALRYVGSGHARGHTVLRILD